MNIALAHDSFTQLGGAERVVERFHRLFPQAPVHVLALDRSLEPHFSGWDIRPSRLQPLYRILPKLKFWLPLIPWAVRSMGAAGVQVVLSSSSGFAKNVPVAPGATHVCYCHTPPRFLWHDDGYLDQELGWLRPLKPLVAALLGRLKAWDQLGTARVDRFVANSREVQRRIRDVYRRDSTVIYPPVDTIFWKPTAEREDNFLLAGRLQLHKKPDFAVRLFTELNLPLRVAGEGRALDFLKSIAGPTVTFLGRITDEQLRDEYSRARAVIFPQHEDLGLVPIEAAACGTPTLAYGAGGATETVLPGVTGELFSRHDVREVSDLVKSWNGAHYNPAALRSHAETFSAERFDREILAFVSSAAKLKKTA